jgi:type IV secretory pathway component VirB8
MHPVDVVVTKIARLDQRDKQDIQACVRKYKLTKSRVLKRAELVEYVGRRENYEINLQYALRNLFSNRTKE